MGISTILILGFGAIIISILLAYKLDMSIGMIALSFCYIISVFLLGEKSTAIVSYWPTAVMINTFGILAFYGVGSSNGTLKTLSRKIIYPFRNIPWAIPLMFAVLVVFLGIISGAGAVMGFLPTLALGVALQGGWNPVLFAAICCWGASIGSSVPFSQVGIMIQGAIANIPEYAETAGALTWKTSGVSMLMFFSFIFIMYIILGGYKVKKIEMEKPDKFTPIQVKTLCVIGIVIALLIVPAVFNVLMPGSFMGNLSRKIHAGSVCMVGFVICTLLKLADTKEVIVKRIPWMVIINMCGVFALINLMIASGASDYMAAMIRENVPRLLIAPMLVVLAGCISFFAAFYSTFPILFPMVFGICAGTGLNPVWLFACIFFGSLVTSLSPFSQGGMVVLAQCPDEEASKKLYTSQIVFAILGMILMLIAAVVFSL